MKNPVKLAKIITLTVSLVTVISVTFFIITSSLVLAWVGPLESPPDGNPPGFIFNKLITEDPQPASINITGAARVGELRVNNNASLVGSLTVGNSICFRTDENCISDWPDFSGGNLWVAIGDNIYNANLGNVGIGTPSPGEKLQVVGNIKLGGTEGDIKDVNAIIGYDDLFLKGNLAENAPVYIAGSQLSFWSGGAEKIRATSAGNVGIGTITPQNILHLNGNNSNFALTFTNLANEGEKRGYRIAFDNNRLTFQSANDNGTFKANQLAIIPDTGNVGIGTTDPKAKLEVKPDIGPNSRGAALIGTGTAYGNFAVVMGENVHASGDNTFALGKNILILGNNSFALGRNIAAIGDNSFGIGLGLFDGSYPVVSAPNRLAIMGGDVRIGTVDDYLYPEGSMPKMVISRESKENISADLLLIQDFTNTPNLNSAGINLAETMQNRWTIVKKTSTFEVPDALQFKYYKDGIYKEILHFNPDGKIGIGTIAPAAKLEVAGVGGSNVDLIVNGRMKSNSVLGGLWLSNQNDGFVGNNGANIGFWTNGVGIGWNALQIVKATGNVGIGTANPKFKLHVNNSGLLVTGVGARVYLGDSKDPEQNLVWVMDNYETVSGDSYDKDFRIYRQNNINTPAPDWQNYFVIKPNGNVGIGAADTSYKLEVGGNIKTDGYYSSDGSAGLTRVINVRKSDNSGPCSLTVKNGLITATTCP